MLQIVAVLLVGLSCAVAGRVVLADEDTTGNMAPQATSTQHPVDETPQHAVPPTAGAERLKQALSESDSDKEEQRAPAKREPEAKNEVDEHASEEAETED